MASTLNTNPDSPPADEAALLTKPSQTKTANLKGLVAGAVAASFVLGLLAATAMTSPAPRAPAALSSYHHDLKCGNPEEAKDCTTKDQCRWPCEECHTKHTAKNKAWLGKCFSASGGMPPTPAPPTPAPPHEHLKCSYPGEAKRCNKNSDCHGHYGHCYTDHSSNHPEWLGLCTVDGPVPAPRPGPRPTQRPTHPTGHKLQCSKSSEASHCHSDSDCSGHCDICYKNDRGKPEHAKWKNKCYAGGEVPYH